MKSNQIFVELVFGQEESFPEEGKVHHIAFTVDNIEEEIEHLKRLKVSFTSDAITTLVNGSKYVFFKGLDGEELVLFQPVSF